MIENHFLTKGQTSARKNLQRYVLPLLLAWLACAAYGGTMLKRGWVPHDDGSFALSAQRVLQGEMPHRDFDELYTGGLTYLNAAAFRLWGPGFSSLRWMLFLFFLAWIPALFYIASRLVGPIAAGGITCLAIAASVPVYSAGVPSWYNLFFATFGTAAMMRFLQVGARGWLFAAGLCAGLSFLAKISGLFFLAAVILFLLFLEQSESRFASATRRISVYSFFLTVGLLVFVVVLFKTVSSSNPAYVAHFVLPGVAIAAYLLWREFTHARGSSRIRFPKFFGFLVPLLIGFLIPVGVFLIPYARAGALHSFLVGVFVSPTKRFSFAALHPTHLRAMNLAATACLAAILYAAGKSRPWARWQKLLLVCVLAALLVASGPVHAVYSFVWSSMVLLVPVMAVMAVLWLAYVPEAEQRQRQQVFLLISVMALTALIQFPFAAPIYYCYVTPLVLLALIALVTLRPSTNRFAFGALLVFYLAFWIFRATPGFIYNLGLRYAPNQQTAKLALPRGGDLRVEPRLADEYGRLIPFIQQHASGNYIYAAPDCPEVYFLSGKQNPTRTLFDFLNNDSSDRNQTILDALDRDHVNVVAILDEPYFSRPLSPELSSALAARFPNLQTIGRFHVRWRE